MFRPPKPEHATIAGPAGALEALIEVSPDSAVRRFAVVCHPHPLYGGTLENKVVHTLARALQQIGLATIRFNFRGVGASEGSYDEGRGESDDALAAVAYGQERWPGAGLWLAGFSFGAYVAARAAGSARPERLLTVAPPVARFDFRELPQPDCPWLIVQGDSDDVVDHREVLAWAAALARPPEVRLLPGGEHFFHGRLHELREIVLAWGTSPPGAAASAQ